MKRASKQLEINLAPSAEALSSVLTEVVSWMSEFENPQWSFDVVSVDSLKAAYRPDEMFIASLAGKPVGCIVLQSRDAVFWPDDKANTALYVHKLAVLKIARGTGVADQMMTWAMARAKESGCQYLRLDCRTDRTGLVDYYAAKGFDKVALKELQRGTFQLFQKSVNS
jgi:predicted N-acetyltransferase YhbS